MREYIYNAAVDSIILERIMMASVPLTLLRDKGHGSKFGEGSNFAKPSTKYGHEEKEVDATCIIISSTCNGSVFAAQNISYALQSYETPSNYATLDNQGTDAGIFKTKYI